MRAFPRRTEAPNWQSHDARWPRLQGAFPQRIIEETAEDLNEFVGMLERLGASGARRHGHEAKFPPSIGKLRAITTIVPATFCSLSAIKLSKRPMSSQPRSGNLQLRKLLIDYMKPGASGYSAQAHASGLLFDPT